MRVYLTCPCPDCGAESSFDVCRVNRAAEQCSYSPGIDVQSDVVGCLCEPDAVVGERAIEAAEREGL
ncbi:MAG: hypothetical protein V2A73_08725 [Pseudomonadota bacterium]